MIGPCLDAINSLNCDPALWECVVIDNGSTDDTVKIAESKGARVFSLLNTTISALRNFGAKKAGGDFVGFIDADCVIDVDWLRNAIASFRDRKVACVGSHPSIPEGGSWVQKAWALQNQRQESVEEVDWLPSMNILVRKSAFCDIDGFNEALMTCEDVDFCYRLKHKGYKIVSNLNIKSAHHGEARTISDFFWKERWRGQSNFRGLQSHGLYLKEIPSLILPSFYLLCIGILPFTLIYVFKNSFLPLFSVIIAILLPCIILATRTCLKAGHFTYFGGLVVLYFVYSLARAPGVIPLDHYRRLNDA